jgi:hypothetical protein
VLKKLPQLFSKEGNRQFFRGHLEMQDPKILVAAAREGDSDALEILRAYARGARRARMRIPDELHEFVWECFIDGPPKAPTGSSPKDADLRYQTTAILVKIASQDYGLPEYRNIEHRGEDAGPISACKLVAEEIGLSERRVEEIWGDRKASVLRPR